VTATDITMQMLVQQWFIKQTSSSAMAEKPCNTLQQF